MVHYVFTNLDALMGFAPPWVRISIWGLAFGAFTMLVYGWLSDQDAIAEIKEEVEETRREMQEYRGEEFEPVLEMAKESLRLSLEQLRIMLVPTLVAGVPVIAVLIWMEESYRHHLPDPGTTIEATVEPPEAIEGDSPSVEWQPSDAVSRKTDGEGAVSLEWPAPDAEGAPRLVDRSSDRTLLALPLEAPRAHVGHYGVWHWFFANPVGYVSDDAPVQSIEVDLPVLYVHPYGPSWLRTWHALFLTMLSISALAAKVGFDID